MSRFLSRLRGEEGWTTLIILNLLALLPVTAFQDARWLDDTQSHLSRAAIAGAWAALLLARTRLPSLLAMPAGLLLGGAAVFAAAGGALPALGTIVSRLGPYWQWLQAVIDDKPHGGDPLSPLFFESVRQTGFLAERFAAWFGTAAGGGTSSDNLVFLVLIALVLWTCAYVSGWALYRWHSPVLGVLPPGVFVLVNVFLANQGWGYMAFYLACALILLVSQNLIRMQRAWIRRGMDFSDELPFDVAFSTSWVAIALVLASLPLPGAASNPVARAWWNTVSAPWSEVETTVNRLFSGINNPNQGLGGGSRSSLILGGSFDPRVETPVFMYITTDEPVPDLRELRELGEEPSPPVHYWRGLTFDTYTGRGWQNTERVNLDRAAGQHIMPLDARGFISLTQFVELVQPRVDLIYATNQPLTVSVAYQVQAMGAEDYASLSFRDLPLTTIRYSVRSLVPNLGEDDLRATPTIYPSWVSSHYLQLPTTLPQRVVDLSRQLTAGAKTPYDKALAIQGYLRKLPYDPRILLPQGDFDAVDYFLFLQKGYCDYFGTTMAVMLRAAGVPARVARGYLPGEYDWNLHRYTVRENRLHVWTEVYFPPYGWIEFEPTPGQPPISRPPGSTLGEQPELPPSEPPTLTPAPDIFSGLGDWGRLLAAAGMIVLVGLLAWTLYPAWEQRLSPSRYAELVYRRMLRYAAWGSPVKRSPSRARTPLEISGSLGRDLAAAPATPWPWMSDPIKAEAMPPAQAVREITETYQAASYGPGPLPATTRPAVRRAWLSIRDRLWARALAARLRGKR